MTYEVTQKQYNILSGLRYWIADEKRMRERFGDEEPELQVCKKTISCLFDAADRENIPFWVQNVAIFSVDNWRRYLDEYTWQALEKKNISCENVTCR